MRCEKYGNNVMYSIANCQHYEEFEWANDNAQQPK